MKRLTRLTTILALLWGLTALTALSFAAPHRGFGPGSFVDANGDGIRDNAPDADGDGIPNGRDPDYVPANPEAGCHFVDADGDGINDNARDTDGDGIPNGRDEDAVRPQDGTGQRLGWLNRVRSSFDSILGRSHGQKSKARSVASLKASGAPAMNHGFGPGDGTGFDHVGPADGTGNGQGATSGLCDGTGPNGIRARR